MSDSEEKPARLTGLLLLLAICGIPALILWWNASPSQELVMDWECKPEWPLAKKSPFGRTRSTEYAIEFWQIQAREMRAEAVRLRTHVPNFIESLAQLDRKMAPIYAEIDRSLAEYTDQRQLTPTQVEANRLRERARLLEQEAAKLESKETWDGIHRENLAKAEGYENCIKRAERELSQLTK